MLKLLRVISSALLILTSPLAPAAEPAPTYSFKDTQLNWGPLSGLHPERM